MGLVVYDNLVYVCNVMIMPVMMMIMMIIIIIIAITGIIIALQT